MTVNRRPAATILHALERVKERCPPCGMGWSVCFKDAQDRVIASFVVQGYGQLDLLVDEVGPLGYSLTILDESVRDADFVFRETSAELPPILANTPAARPPKPRMPDRRAITKGDLAMEDCGGPIMLVRTVSEDLAYCVWFSETAEVHSGTFAVGRLVNVSGATRRLQEAAAHPLVGAA